LLAAHGAARIDPKASKRGPGRWLSVTEREALGPLPPPRGAALDVSTRVGQVLFVAFALAWAAGVFWLSRRSSSLALLLGFDAVILLAIFGTGRSTSLPPDLAVEPARFLRPLAARLRAAEGLEHARIVPRIRIPHGAVDPDELRLMVVPRLALRGFGGIEIGVTYAVGLGARVAMPEVLLRVVSGSPCDIALANMSRKARITPGRKPDERVIAFAPRLPTVRMTAEIARALAMRVVDRDALAKRARGADKSLQPAQAA
jgi:hypothetical protein